VLVALHARRSHASVRRFVQAHPGAPVVVALTGTDLYVDLARGSRAARESLDLATRIVALQPRMLRALPPAQRRKARVILQAAEAVRPRVAAPRERFRVCVLSHMRPVKDPFLAAQASRLVPDASGIEVVHAGAALGRAMSRRARLEAGRSPRWRWVGDLPHAAAMRLLASSHVLALTSTVEGGAGVLSEALAFGVPVVATRIEGVLGVLGPRHPGLFDAGDARGLADLLRRAETEPSFLARLRRAGARRARGLSPAREAAAWRSLIGSLGR
jgi:putative glycosyltransferase (TIGR04348 family)